MSVREFKSALERMSAAERAEIAAHLRILRWKETPHLAEELASAHAKMDAGRKVTEEDLERYLANRRASK
jgi:hypothetical protein